MPRPSKANGEPGVKQVVSLKTLGEHLNLSPATISLVLNNAPGVRSIPQETRDRVIEAAAKFNYRPSFYARSLRKRQSFSIGVLVQDLNGHYTAEVLSGVEELLMEEGYFFFTASHHGKPDLLEEYPQLMMDRSVEGLILVDTMLEHALPLPVVAVAGHKALPGVTNVVLDQRRGVELALRHLVQLGHKRVAFMRGGSHSADADDRWRCVTTVARDLGLPMENDLCAEVTLRSSGPELGYGPTESLLERGARFTAIFCYNDECAFGAIRALVDHGLRVPQDVSVVGFDDIHSAGFHNPSLTTIRQPLGQMGSVAARILLQRVRGQASFPDSVAILPELVVRESTAAPGAGTAKARKVC